MDLHKFLILGPVGGIAGVLADRFVGGVRPGLAGAILVGVIGAFIGGWLLAQPGATIARGPIGSILVAFLGTLVLLLPLRTFRH